MQSFTKRILFDLEIMPKHLRGVIFFADGMVDLPPNTADLNEYARFAFLNEMHTIASQILSIVSGDRPLATLISAAIEAMDSERASMRDLFTGPYERPASRQCVALLLRCAELYLEYGAWYDISRAEVRLIESGNGDNLKSIRNSFHKSGVTDRYSIESAVIELTITRLEMMKFFEFKQNELFKGIPSDEHDPLSNIELPSFQELNEAEKCSISSIPDDITSPTSLLVDDREYLDLRETCAWAAFREFRTVGSVFVILWFAIFTGLLVASLLMIHERYVVTECVSIGYSLCMLLFELISFRLCFGTCVKPKEPNCLYPGYELYFIQYTASWIGGIAMLVSIFVFGQCQQPGATIMILQHMVSVVLPIFFQCCFFTWHTRVERTFKWVRVGFFKSCGWKFVQALFCLLFTPGILGVQTIISSALRNRPSVKHTKHTKHDETEELVP